MTNQISKIILGGGCFWCLEAAFQRMNGVTKVISGYAGGDQATANYSAVCSGNTEHAEVVLVEWDNNQTSLAQLLTCFFSIHDATTLNRQGNDVGTQYRSFIGYFDEEQLTTIQQAIASATAERPQPIVTELNLNPEFFAAEISHQDYYNRNSNQPYCQMVIRPKIDKVKALQES